MVPQRTGPRRASKLTPELVSSIAVLRAQGLSLRAIGERVAVSEASVRRALSENSPAGTETETETETETDYPATVSGVEPDPGGQTPSTPMVCGDVVPVLADPVDRCGERVLAAFGLIEAAAPVFTGCGRAPLAGLLGVSSHLCKSGVVHHRIAVWADRRSVL